MRNCSPMDLVLKTVPPTNRWLTRGWFRLDAPWASLHVFVVDGRPTERMSTGAPASR